MLTTKVSQTTLQMQYEEKHTRIRNHKKKNAKIMLEEAWERFAFTRLEKGDDVAYSIIFKNSIVTGLIRRTAKSFYKAWKKNSRLSMDDLESVLYEKAWNVIGDYSPHGDWYLYEHLKRGFMQTCIDLLRQQGLVKDRPNKYTAFHKASSLTMENKKDREIVAPHNVETEAITNVWIQQALDTEETAVAKLLLMDSYTNSADICATLGIKYRQQAIRITRRVRKKFVAVDE